MLGKWLKIPCSPETYFWGSLNGWHLMGTLYWHLSLQLYSLSLTRDECQGLSTQDTIRCCQFIHNKQSLRDYSSRLVLVHVGWVDSSEWVPPPGVNFDWSGIHRGGNLQWLDEGGKAERGKEGKRSSALDSLKKLWLVLKLWWCSRAEDFLR